MSRVSLDCDIIVAAYEEQRRAVRRLIVRRARREWKRVKKEKGGRVARLTEEGGKTHWQVKDGLTSFCELAACGRETGEPVYANDGRTDYGSPITCVACLKLLKAVAGKKVWAEEAAAFAAELKRRHPGVAVVGEEEPAPEPPAEAKKPVRFREFL